MLPGQTCRICSLHFEIPSFNNITIDCYTATSRVAFAMGGNTSRAVGENDKQTITVRKQIGRRSSLNILKRIGSYSDSRPTATPLPIPTVHVKAPSEPIVVRNIAADSPPISVLTVSSNDSKCTTVVRKSTDESEVDNARFNTSQEDVIEGRRSVSAASSRPSIRIVTPAPFLPSPSVLEEESPTKYGLNQHYNLEQDAATSKAKRQTKSGAELFEVSPVVLPKDASGSHKC